MSGEPARCEIPDRTLQLNHESYRQECEQGYHWEKKSGKNREKKLSSRETVCSDEDLFCGPTYSDGRKKR